MKNPAVHSLYHGSKVSNHCQYLDFQMIATSQSPGRVTQRASSFTTPDGFFCELQISLRMFWNIGGNNISEIFPLLVHDLIFSPKPFGILKTFQMFIYIQYLIFKELTT